jgi:hypothetical protein
VQEVVKRLLVVDQPWKPADNKSIERMGIVFVSGI